MTITTKNKYMLFGAIGLLRILFVQKQISEQIYLDFMRTMIYADDEKQQAFIIQFVHQFQHQPLKRGRKKTDFKIICENLPIILSDDDIERQEDSLNWTFLRTFHPT